MKKLLSLILCLTVFAVQAQKDPQAMRILDAMSKKYKSYETYKADFTYSLINDVEDIRDDFSGSILVKGDQYKLDLGNQVIYNNGETVWTYLPEVNEVNISNANEGQMEMSPSTIYTVYKKGFKVVYYNSTTISGKKYHLIDLIPEDRREKPYWVRLSIQDGTNDLKSYTISEDSGNKYVYDIKSFKPNASASSSEFAFNKSKYPGVEIIDLR
ncbi:LolA family protein [Marinigracilibium pacificum]|uniref:Outer membrane lipoprotein carrier protein LolA n=1 Tax=Marinigracilibium pacificum TaxID=2729599 RepID=A0A848J3M9_9BACT|nr:outer membrane lipoprotein carrier protein LolA [Marinigracilibium pacificum]NMM49094.1 outer membrane lipoprotein carrier protein LolA [Marinigracilibium pacificum]